MKQLSHLWQYFAKFFLEWEMFRINVVKKIETFFEYFFFSRKSRRLWDNVEKRGRARDATEDNMSLAHCMLGN